MTGEHSERDVIRLRRGAFCISIDLELLWGVWDHVTASDARECADLEREIVPKAAGVVSQA